MSWDDMAQWLPVMAAVAGLVFAGEQIRLSRRVSRVEVMLQMDQRLADFNELQHRLEHNEVDVSSVKDQREIRRYIGTLERLKVIIDSGMLSIQNADRLYSFRVRTVAQNPYTRTLIETESRGWRNFSDLVVMLEEYRRKGSTNPWSRWPLCKCQH